MPDITQAHDAVNATVDAGTSLVGLAGAGGGGVTALFSGWLVKRFVSNTIPRLATTFEKANEAKDQAFEMAIKALMTESREQREMFERRIERAEERAAEDRKHYLELVKNMISEVGRG
jgi:transcription elongation factor GreA-like protein